MVRRKVWKGGPRSRRSYISDYHRKAKTEKRSTNKGHVRPHYRKKKRGGSTKVRWHKRRSSKTGRR